jgi:hypothetical protein
MVRPLTFDFAWMSTFLAPPEITRHIILRLSSQGNLRSMTIHRKCYLLLASGPDKYCHHVSPALARSAAPGLCTNQPKNYASVDQCLEKPSCHVAVRYLSTVSVLCGVGLTFMFADLMAGELRPTKELRPQYLSHRLSDCTFGKVEPRFRRHDQAYMGKINMTSSDQRLRSKA